MCTDIDIKYTFEYFIFLFLRCFNFLYFFLISIWSLLLFRAKNQCENVCFVVSGHMKLLAEACKIFSFPFKAMQTMSFVHTLALPWSRVNTEILR